MPVNVFGGGAVQTAQVEYRRINLTSDVVLVWPTSYVDTSDVVANYMSVVTDDTERTIILPKANQASVGQNFIISNIGTSNFRLLTSDGYLFLEVETGKSFYVVLADNSDTVGVWESTQFGAGTSAADATILAGNGLTVLSEDPQHLNTNIETEDVFENIEMVNSPSDRFYYGNYRAKLLIWTGDQSGEIKLPFIENDSGPQNGFYFSVKNSGFSQIEIATVNGNTIDGKDKLTILSGESLTCTRAEAEWITFGQARTVVFPVKSLDIDLSNSGATITLTLEQASRVLQKYHGTPEKTVNITYPKSDGYWFISNQTGSSAKEGKDIVLFSVDHQNIEDLITVKPGYNAIVCISRGYMWIMSEIERPGGVSV